MSYLKLSIQGFIKEIKDVSGGIYPRKFCFVLGAGASKTSGIMTGQQLVDIWDQELSVRYGKEHEAWKKENNINDNNKYRFYSKYYERRFSRVPKDGYNYLERMMQEAEPSIGYIMLAYLMSQTEHNAVITTNFDHLIEKALTMYTHDIPMVIGHESLVRYLDVKQNRPVIIKIHHDILLNPQNTTDELMKLHQDWEKALETIFREYNPIFIGYAGNDNSLMQYLVDNSNKFANNEWAVPYWIVYKNNILEEMVEEFLNLANGYLIRYEGFDEVMCLLGEEFACSLPSEEEFQSEAIQRYQKLVNSMNGFKNKKHEQSHEKEKKEAEITNSEAELPNMAEQYRKYKVALDLQKNGLNEDAIKLFKELVESEPQNAEYHYRLGKIYHKMSKKDEAINEFRKAVKQDTLNHAIHHSEYYFDLANILFEQGQWDDDLDRMISRAIHYAPEIIEYRELRIQYLITTGRNREAEREKQRIQNIIAVDKENNKI
ncbi:MAG: SIR2 family protein [Lachnospiraceae bacterium]|nr:SIR2 family protein [Lachnospiraceae bacterium]